MNNKREHSTNLLEVKGVSKWFPIRRGVLSRTIGHVKAVNDVNLNIRKGETVGLVGESGCGKTTLGRTIVGLESPTTGEILFNGRSIASNKSFRDAGLRRRIQMIFQDPYSSLNPRMSISDIVSEGMISHKMFNRSDALKEAERLLAEVGLDGRALNRYPHEFSGGQRQRISIARALSLKPEMIVCDEAVSALDVSVQAQVINLLIDLKEKYDLSLLFISHDLSVVHHISDRVAVMYLGRVVEEGPVELVINHPKHPYSRSLIESIPVPGRNKKLANKTILKGEIPSPANPPSGCPFHTRCPKIFERCKLEIPKRVRTDARDVWCHLYDM